LRFEAFFFCWCKTIANIFKSIFIILKLKSKVEILEKSLSQVVREFEHERTNIIKQCKTEMDSSVIELEKTKRTLELRNKEMNKVKKLAKNILEQRSDIERFFLDSLDYVKKQIVSNRFVFEIILHFVTS